MAAAKKTSAHKKFLLRLREIAASHESLLALARRLCSGCRRPSSIDPEDHRQDAVLLILELNAATKDTFKFPVRDLSPEEWVYRSVRRVFHSRAFYFREFSWASRRAGGCVGADSDSEDGQGVQYAEQLAVTPLTEFDVAIEDLCDHVPEPCRPLLRLMSQGATTLQAAAVLGKKRSWVQWRLGQIRKALRSVPSVHCPHKFTKLLMSPKK